MTIKLKIIMIIAAALILSTEANLFAIGSFSMGINAGATYDPNYLQNDINSYNKEIENQSGKQIDIPYAFAFGANFRYQFNYVLFRIGGYYTEPYYGTDGSCSTNKIHISTFQAAFPISVAFTLPIKERGNFFIGGGLSLYVASVKFTQSNPAAGPIPTADMRDSYYGIFPGWHIIAGAEVPLLDRYSISVEWIHQEGRSAPLSNNGLDSTGAPTSGPKRIINARGDFFLFGVNYYISI